MQCGTMNPSDGSVAKKSKTEAVFYPPDGYSPTTNDTLFLRSDDALDIITFTERSRYLGAILSSSLTDDFEVEQRIRSAAAAFGCLRTNVFGQSFGSASLPLASKGKLYRLPSPRARHLALRLRVLGADCGTPAQAEHVPQITTAACDRWSRNRSALPVFLRQQHRPHQDSSTTLYL
jgi:hypothetical protein